MNNAAVQPVTGGGESPLPRSARRLLAALDEAGARAVADPTREDAVIVRGGGTGISLGRGHHPAAAAEDLHRRDLVTRTTGAGRASYVLSAAGAARLKRLAAEDPETAFAAQHRDLVRDADAAVPALRNAAESPLDWLRRRKDAAGSPMIDPASFEAGERLRRDLTIGGILPSVSARWDGGVGGGAGASRDPAGATDAVIAARQRVRRALEAVGPDMADLLVDLCGFLKGLEQLERDRRWPPRSAKVVVGLALRRLAEHYGLEVEATGPAASRGIRAWSDRPAAQSG